jgi:hypothetical protein
MAGKMPSGSAPLSVNSSVWQMPVALISTRTSPLARAFEIDGLERKGRSGLAGDGGSGLHRRLLGAWAAMVAVAGRRVNRLSLPGIS